MKKIAILLVAVFTSGYIFNVNAQMQGPMKHDSAHWSGMHRNMIHADKKEDMKGMEMHERMSKMMHEDGMSSLAPVRQLMPYVILIKKLPGMQQQLGLTDDQVSKMVDLQASFAKQKIDLKAELTKKELKLKNLIKNNASSKEISDQLTACAASRISIAVSAYETANKMKGVLNDSQKQKLNEMIEKFHSRMHDSDE